jgi:hypothetical protein
MQSQGKDNEMNEAYDVRSAIVNTSKGNPGALRVCFEFLEAFQEMAGLDFGLLVAKGIVGSEVWDLYKCCNRSVTAMHESIVNDTAIGMLEGVPGSSFYKPEGVTHA